MTKFIALLYSIIMVIAANAQDAKAPPLDKSPMDMSYYPDQYPLQKFQGKITTPPSVRIIYGRPQKDGRTIFGDLIKYKEIWRIGANEATEIELYKDAKIDGKKVAKGRYTLYCIPTETTWTFIINKDTDSWGAFKYDEKKDIVRFKATVKKLETEVETLSIFCDKTTTGCTINVSWDKSTAAFPVIF